MHASPPAANPAYVKRCPELTTCLFMRAHTSALEPRGMPLWPPFFPFRFGRFFLVFFDGKMDVAAISGSNSGYMDVAVEHLACIRVTE